MKHIYPNGKTNPPKCIYRVTEDDNVIKIQKAWRAVSNTEYIKV